GETTYRATRGAIEYAQAEPVVAKGKADPIPVWEALVPRARVAVERLGGADLVGREHEVTLLRDALARVKQEREPQLVTLVAVSELMDDQGDARWVQTQLRPLIGASGDGELRGAGREEAFAAWRRFFESMAERRPTVMVFEDLHWADDDLLDFVDELVDWAGG